MMIVVQILGGIGIFLLGMMLMIDGLKALAGDALRNVLARVVKGPISGVLCGAGATALVQSSSATTITTIGFVSAGLLTFTQAVGVILGANIGTTSTGWIVSQLGFKVSISAGALPIIFIGVLLRLLFRHRLAKIGLALAGFGLIFVGLEALEAGMSSLSGTFDPADLPGARGGVLGILLLVGVGVAMTVVMQSSSAAVATTLAALYTGTIEINQAAALVIGQNIGTTVTAAIASIGASIPARRTAVAHILFNILTGIVALLLLPLFAWIMQEYIQRSGPGAEVTAIAGFHTAFNLLGTILLLPFIFPFCRAIERLLPEDEPTLTRHLDASVAGVLPVAVEAARRTLIDILREIINVIEPTLQQGAPLTIVQQKLEPVSTALDHTRGFLSRVTAEQQTQAQSDRLLMVLHAADHVMRLHEVCLEDWPAGDALRDPAARDVERMLAVHMPQLRAWFADPESGAPHAILQEASQAIAERRRATRAALLEEAACGRRDAHRALALLEAIRLIDQVAYHLWRATWHLQPTPPKEAASSAGSQMSTSASAHE